MKIKDVKIDTDVVNEIQIFEIRKDNELEELVRHKKNYKCVAYWDKVNGWYTNDITKTKEYAEKDIKLLNICKSKHGGTKIEIFLKQKQN